MHEKMNRVVLNNSQVCQISVISRNFKLLKFEFCRLPLLCGWYVGSSGLLRGIGWYLFNDFFWTACRSHFRESVKIRLNSGDVCIFSVQNRLSFSLVSKNRKTSIYRSLMLPVMRV